MRIQTLRCVQWDDSRKLTRNAARAKRLRHAGIDSCEMDKNHYVVSDVPSSAAALICFERLLLLNKRRHVHFTTPMICGRAHPLVPRVYWHFVVCH